MFMGDDFWRAVILFWGGYLCSGTLGPGGLFGKGTGLSRGSHLPDMSGLETDGLHAKDNSLQ